ncbi:MAG: hypothetical protein JWQ23_1206 [Herminiimonas sp.]|nr:hypothetical protein [Herminiimonas sp.]
MKGLANVRSVSLEKNALLVLSLREPYSVCVTSGRAWITMERDRDDYWLSAGDTFLLAPNPRIVIESDSPRTDLYFVRFPGVVSGALSRLRRLTSPAPVINMVSAFQR